MWNKQRYCGQLQNHVRIANFRGGSRKITIPSKSSYFFMVLWHAWSCKEVCGTILWDGKQEDSATLQSIYSMHRWPPLQRRRNEICWRIVTCVLSNCSEFVTRFSPFCDWSCKFFHWQILGSHTFVPISWMCEETNFSFAQFNRIRNHFLGRSIKVGRKTRTWFMGSVRCSSWEQESEPYRTGRFVKERT